MYYLPDRAASVIEELYWAEFVSPWMHSNGEGSGRSSLMTLKVRYQE